MTKQVNQPPCFVKKKWRISGGQNSCWVKVITGGDQRSKKIPSERKGKGERIVETIHSRRKAEMPTPEFSGGHR